MLGEQLTRQWNEWPHLQRYGVPQEEWRPHRAAVDEWLPDYLNERVAIPPRDDPSLANDGAYDRINRDNRRRTIAIIEAASSHGGCIIL